MKIQYTVTYLYGTPGRPIPTSEKPSTLGLTMTNNVGTDEGASWLEAFAQENNRLSERPEPSTVEIDATRWFLKQHRLGLYHIETIAGAFEPGVRLRQADSHAVEDEDVLAPTGGAQIVKSIQRLIDTLSARTSEDVLRAFVALKPFTAGNGRIARLLWLWHIKWCVGPVEFDVVRRNGFLQTFYERMSAASRYTARVLASEHKIEFLESDQAIVWVALPRHSTAVELAIALHDGKTVLGARITRDVPPAPKVSSGERERVLS